MRQYIFYKYDSTLHDIIEDGVDIEDSIDPGTLQKYDMSTFIYHFFSKDITEIVDDEDRETLRYLAKHFPDDLIEDLRDL